MKIHSIYKIICIFLFRDEIIINKPILAYLPIRRAVVLRARTRETTARLCIKQTQFRKRRHGAERGFALTRLAKSSLIRHAVAVAFSAEIIGVFVLQNLVCRFVLLCRVGVAPLFRNHIFIVKIVFKSRFVIVSKMSILRTTMSLLSRSLAFRLFIVQCTEKGRKSTTESR